MEAGMGVFDQAARYVARLNPGGFFGWTVANFAADHTFVRWADTRSVPFPGDPDRTADRVAEFVARADRSDRRLLNVEFQSEPDPDMLERLGEYAVRLRLDVRHGAGQAGKFLVHSLLLTLTGPEQADTLDMRHAGLGGGHVLQTFQRTLREMDAAGTLRRIAAGGLDRCVLPWIPLMRGADEAGTVQEWRRLAEQEPDRRLRSDYGALALIFAELSGRAALWKQGLEGWNTRESQQVLEWQNEARVEAELRTARAYLLEALEIRFQSVP